MVSNRNWPVVSPVVVVVVDFPTNGFVVAFAVAVSVGSSLLFLLVMTLLVSNELELSGRDNLR